FPNCHYHHTIRVVPAQIVCGVITPFSQSHNGQDDPRAGVASAPGIGACTSDSNFHEPHLPIHRPPDALDPASTASKFGGLAAWAAKSHRSSSHSSRNHIFGRPGLTRGVVKFLRDAQGECRTFCSNIGVLVNPMKSRTLSAAFTITAILVVIAAAL